MIAQDRRGDVAIVRLDAPPLNLLGSGMIAALGDAMRALASDPPRVAVLHCSGAGADVREMAGLDGPAARRFITALHESCRTIRDLDAPVIAAIDGPCLGAHLEVAAACDLRIASARSRFGMPEIKVGIPSVIDAWWLVQICGLGHTSSLVFDGEMIDAGEAHRIGLVNRVTADDGLEREALEWAGRIARFAPAGLVEQKRVIRDWTDEPYREAARRSIDRLVAAFESGQSGEAMRAMLEKREPKFS
ncbi:MAG TPA: enoyl-CoA hydratase-related protein [Actinomycetota bacterium]|nr:enoyl-CoA hydratase-related protein [Actinomycetota bacterium]